MRDGSRIRRAVLVRGTSDPIMGTEKVRCQAELFATR